MRRGAEIEAIVSADIYASGSYLPRLKFPKVQGVQVEENENRHLPERRALSAQTSLKPAARD